MFTMILESAYDITSKNWVKLLRISILYNGFITTNRINEIDTYKYIFNNSLDFYFGNDSYLIKVLLIVTNLCFKSKSKTHKDKSLSYMWNNNNFINKT